jgi:chromate transporter
VHAGTPAEVLAVALRLGLTSFGGAIAHFGYFRREYVERRRWLDEATFADLLALAQSLPGPASSQLGMAIGHRRAGLGGAIAAWLGFTLPSAVILIGFATATTSVDLSRAGWVHGLQLAAVAVVASAVVAMWRALAPDLPRTVLALSVAALLLLWVSPFAQPAAIVIGAIVGRAFIADDRPAPPVPAPLRRFPGGRRSALALGLFVVLLVGLPLLRLATDAPVVATVDAFYRSGSLVFGGGHVVLPLLHTTVVDPGWVTEDRFLAGYGLTQAMPGPLFTFAGYLGAASSLPPGGVAGGIIAIVAVFLPSFLLLIGLLPAWETVRGWPGARSALVGVNAAVVGLLAAALVTPVITTTIVTPLDAGVAAVGAVALVVGRVPPWAVVVGAAAIGQLAG